MGQKIKKQYKPTTHLCIIEQSIRQTGCYANDTNTSNERIRLTSMISVCIRAVTWTTNDAAARRKNNNVLRRRPLILWWHVILGCNIRGKSKNVLDNAMLLSVSGKTFTFRAWPEWTQILGLTSVFWRGGQQRKGRTTLGVSSKRTQNTAGGNEDSRQIQLRHQSLDSW